MVFHTPYLYFSPIANSVDANNIRFVLQFGIKFVYLPYH